MSILHPVTRTKHQQNMATTTATSSATTRFCQHHGAREWAQHVIECQLGGCHRQRTAA